VRNPLKGFILPVDLSYHLEKGHNPTDKPNYIIPNWTFVPFTPAGYPTIRYPNSNYEDQYDLLNKNVNHGVRSDNSEVPNVDPGHPSPSKIAGGSHFASLETTHDAFHIIFGGPGGHMAYLDIASFDPMFFFHHVNVDRLFALWQEIFPDGWIQQNIDFNGTFTDEMYTTVDENTDLTPFRKTKTEFWKSSDVRDIESLGYTYPQTQIFRKKPGKLVGPYAIRVFIDLKNATAQTPVTSPNFAGLVAMWQKIRRQIYEPDGVNATTGLIDSKTIFDIKADINLVPILLDGKGISPKKVGVNKIEVFSFEHDKVGKNFLVENTGQYYGSKEF
ncbi:207_t:CDS:2, partial [Dentiscutata heterogama]